MLPRFLRLCLLPTLFASSALAEASADTGPQRPHNLIVFVADGLRSALVTPQTAPVMAEIRSKGVDFGNSHALFPTVTTVNGSAIATGHRIGDTGDFGNTLWAGAPVNPNSPSKFASVEDDDTLAGLDVRFGGNYLNAETFLAAARARGFSTAVIGKLGPALEMDSTARDGQSTIIIDDGTGYPGGVPLAPDVKAAIKAEGLPVQAEDRGLNGDPGDNIRSGVHVANVQQQDWMAAVATKVVLPRFKAADKPFILIFWSRDPDGTQHNTGDSLLKLEPGINGPTSLAGVKNADDDLGRLMAAVKALGLEATTDVIVTADHGFSTAAKESATSGAAKARYADVPKGFLPPGFLGIDLGAALGLPVSDAYALEVDPAQGVHAKSDGQILGDPANPVLEVASQGGSDVIWIPETQDRKALAQRIVAVLTTEDYLSAVFVDDGLGPIPGTLPLSAVGLEGSALTPHPALIVGFRSFSTGCANPELCAAEVADTYLQQGQGIHGSFSRADTHNFMAALGPDFKAGFRDPAPVSNADWAPTIAHILGFDLNGQGVLKGRVVLEALAAGAPAPAVTTTTVRSDPGPGGFTTVLDAQALTLPDGRLVTYLDAAGMPGRVVGLRP